MKIKWQCAMLSIVFFALAVQGRQQGSRSHSAIHPAVDPDWSALMDSMRQMDVAMTSVEPSGSSDVDFVRLMLPHHQAAIDMAKAQLLYGKDPQMQRLAQEIITDQQSEIDLMQLWLKEHGPGSPKVDKTPAVRASRER